MFSFVCSSIQKVLAASEHEMSLTIPDTEVVAGNTHMAEATPGSPGLEMDSDVTHSGTVVTDVPPSQAVKPTINTGRREGNAITRSSLWDLETPRSSLKTEKPRKAESSEQMMVQGTALMGLF